MSETPKTVKIDGTTGLAQTAKAATPATDVVYDLRPLPLLVSLDNLTVREANERLALTDVFVVRLLNAPGGLSADVRQQVQNLHFHVRLARGAIMEFLDSGQDPLDDAERVPGLQEAVESHIRALQQVEETQKALIKIFGKKEDIPASVERADVPPLMSHALAPPPFGEAPLTSPTTPPAGKSVWPLLLWTGFGIGAIWLCDKLSRTLVNPPQYAIHAKTPRVR